MQRHLKSLGHTKNFFVYVFKVVFLRGFFCYVNIFCNALSSKNDASSGKCPKDEAQRLLFPIMAW